MTDPFGAGRASSDQPFSIANWFVGPDATGADGGTIGDLQGRTQDAVTGILQGMIKGSTGWTGSSASVYDGLRAGISLPLAIIEALVNRLFGTNINFDDMGSVLDAIELIPGVSTIIQIIKDASGVDLGTVFDGIDLLNPGAVMTAITNAVAGVITGALQHVIDAIVGGLTGTSATGNDPVSIAFALLNQAAALPGNLLALLFGGQATTQAQVNALTNGGFTHDFGSNGVTGWTNLLGTLALSTRGNYVQAATETIAYRAGIVTVDKLGAHAVVTPSMRGVVRLGICATSTASNWAGVEVYRGFDGDAVRLVTGASPTLTVVQKQADFVGTNRLPDSTTVDIRTDGVNKFTVLCNGQPVAPLDWTDGSGIITHDSSHRNVLLTSNGSDRRDDGSYGPAITKVVSYAW